MSDAIQPGLARPFTAGIALVVCTSVLTIPLACSSGGSSRSAPGPSATTAGGTTGSGTASPAPVPAPTPPSPAPTPSPAPAPTPSFVPAGTHDPAGLLSTIPDALVANGGDPIHIQTAIASDSFTDRDPADVPTTLRLVTWNVHKGFEADTIADELASHPELRDADFLLLTEVARLDEQSDPPMIDQTRRLAERLRMDYVFGVQWDRREREGQRGEMGTAILSKYPLGNVTHIRHTPVHPGSRYQFEKIYGGRNTLAADALVGGRRVRLYASHFATRDPEGLHRAVQAREVRADAALPDRPALQIAAGDFNSWNCLLFVSDCTQPPAAETCVREFLSEGWTDGTRGFTGHTQIGLRFFRQRLDWIFHRGGLADVPGQAVLDAQGSDHFPLYFDFSMP